MIGVKFMNDVITDVNPDSGLSILEGILTAAGFKDDPDCWERINISRGGEKLFSFRIRPLDEQEVADLRRQCTRFLPNPNGAGYPRVEGEVNLVRLRSMKIYAATVPDDRALIWDSAEARQRLGVMRGEDMIDCVLMAGEKDAVIERIDALSGYGARVFDTLKN